MIGVVDYGMGNLHSVEKALQRLQADAIRLSDPNQAQSCEALLLPGVGALIQPCKSSTAVVGVRC